LGTFSPVGSHSAQDSCLPMAPNESSKTTRQSRKTEPTTWMFLFTTVHAHRLDRVDLGLLRLGHISEARASRLLLGHTLPSTMHSLHPAPRVLGPCFFSTPGTTGGVIGRKSPKHYINQSRVRELRRSGSVGHHPRFTAKSIRAWLGGSGGPDRGRSAPASRINKRKRLYHSWRSAAVRVIAWHS